MIPPRWGRLDCVEPNQPAAWIAAPVLVVAGLALVLARKPIGSAYAKQYAKFRRAVPSMPEEPISLRRMVPIVGAGWMLTGLAIAVVLIWG